MAARNRLKQMRIRSRGGRGFAFDDQPEFHPAPLHLERYEPRHRQAGSVSGFDRVGYESLQIQRHSDATAFQLNSIDQVTEAIGDFRAFVLELFALRPGCFERRLQVADRHSSFLQLRGDSWPISEHLAARACDCPLDPECWQTPPILRPLCRTLNYLCVRRSSSLHPSNLSLLPIGRTAMNV